MKLFCLRHAEWFRLTRAELIKTLAPIQFQILLQKCQNYDENSQAPVSFDEEEFRDESDLNHNTFMKMWNSTYSPNLPMNGTPFDVFNDNFDENLFKGYENDSPIIFPGTKKPTNF